MIRTSFIQKQCALRFCRWSRAKYAVFCSLHRYVTIGHVGKSIADSALRKTKKVCSVWLAAVCQKSCMNDMNGFFMEEIEDAFPGQRGILVSLREVCNIRWNSCADKTHAQNKCACIQIMI